MQRRLLYLILPVIILIMEILPYGAVCNFATGPDEIIRKTFSYFDLVPFGYANFAPLLTAILTCVTLILLVIYLFTGKHPMLTFVKTVLCVAVILSFCPLLYGISYYSLVGILITVSLIAELILICILEK